MSIRCIKNMVCDRPATGRAAPAQTDGRFWNVGPVVRLSPGEVDISDISAAKEIHRVNGHFLKASWYQTITPKGVHNLWNTSDPEFHKRHRRVINMFLSDTFLGQMQPLVDRKVQLTIEQMKRDMGDNNVVNVDKWWMLMTSDIIGELSFGESPKAIEMGEVSSSSNSVGRRKGINALFDCSGK
jgi:cytochrome P450